MEFKLVYKAGVGGILVAFIGGEVIPHYFHLGDNRSSPFIHQDHSPERPIIPLNARPPITIAATTASPSLPPGMSAITRADDITNRSAYQTFTSAARSTG